MPGHRGAGRDGLRSHPPGRWGRVKATGRESPGSSLTATGAPPGVAPAEKLSGAPGGLDAPAGHPHRPGTSGVTTGGRNARAGGEKGAARSRFMSGELDARRGRHANAAMEGRVVLFPPRVAQSPKPPTDLPWGAGASG